MIILLIIPLDIKTYFHYYRQVYPNLKILGGIHLLSIFIWSELETANSKSVTRMALIYA
jgi:hypothetical protein